MRGHLRVLELDGALVAQSSLQRLHPALCRHVASLAVGVHPDHQRRGHATRMMTDLIERARWEGIVRLELYVRADNTRAHGLYTRCGFVRESVRRRFVRLPDGTFVDDWCMVRFLDDAG